MSTALGLVMGFVSLCRAVSIILNPPPTGESRAAIGSRRRRLWRGEGSLDTVDHLQREGTDVTLSVVSTLVLIAAVAVLSPILAELTGRISIPDVVIQLGLGIVI